jgi:hypothetical protein
MPPTPPHASLSNCRAANLASVLKFRTHSADQRVMPTDPIIIIIGAGSLLEWLLCCLS